MGTKLRKPHVQTKIKLFIQRTNLSAILSYINLKWKNVQGIKIKWQHQAGTTPMSVKPITMQSSHQPHAFLLSQL